MFVGMHNDPPEHEPQEVFPVKDWEAINWNRWNNTVLEGE